MSLQAAFDLLLGADEPLLELDQFVWQSLSEGVQSKGHPWNEADFATIDITDGAAAPRSRTVILRGADQASRTLDCYTDVRAGKVTQIQASGGEVCWLFYKPTTKIQLRLEGVASIIDGPTADEAWQQTPLQSREAYLSLATPGNAVPGVHPPDTGDRKVSEPSSERGRENFRIVHTRITKGDLLYLRAGGHVRAQFSYSDSGQAHSTWVVA